VFRYTKSPRGDRLDRLMMIRRVTLPPVPVSHLQALGEIPKEGTWPVARPMTMPSRGETSTGISHPVSGQSATPRPWLDEEACRTETGS